ncbi:hypothetical protein OJ967_14655 [Peribacillus frigoritolerans]|uniref:hypothetical protein n=1 Tax=Peribacillus frigoritolerans TaxID=450367 RepID=UPI0022276603|nr:hypothetical protein [Peribacillus frigoritolerans]UYY96729.1 hypothetical protein OJ967_14655 [Peribacillus frigoritolerans]
MPDLYLPVLSTFKEVDAIMVYSRYGTPFTDQEVEERVTLAKKFQRRLTRSSFTNRRKRIEG